MDKQKGYNPERAEPSQTGWSESKGLAPILIIILIAISLGGYLFIQKQSKPVSISQPSPSPVTSPVASSSAETVDTEQSRSANWKAYTDSVNRFSFKYPETWGISAEVLQKSSKDSLDNWFQSFGISQRQNPTCDNCFQVFTKKELKIDTYQSIVAETANHPGGRRMSAYILLNETKVIKITGAPLTEGNPDKSLSQKAKDDFDQILSTFRFDSSP